MTQGFQQQNPMLNYMVRKSAPSPQHGQKAAATVVAPAPPKRSFEPRPGR